MRELDTLIRLHRWQLAEKRRELVELEVLAERFQEELRALDDEVARETAAAEAEPQLPMGFAAYLRASRKRRQRLEQSIAQVEEQIAAARDRITAAFQELKGYEVARDNRKKRADDRRRQRETVEMDEVAVTGFQRRRSANGAP